MTAKTIDLTIGQRVATLKLFDAFKGSLETLATLLEDVKQFSVSEEEWATANLTKTPSEDGNTIQWKWDDDKVSKEIVLQKPTADFLEAEIMRKSAAGEITLADVALIEVNKKLNA